MPRYDYKHCHESCEAGEIIEIVHSIHDDAKTECPYCGRKIERLISAVNINTPTSNSELKEKGFAKLVRRDKGVYENVTATKNESRYFHADKPETMPDIKKRIRD